MNDAENIALFDMDGTLCDYEGQLKNSLLALASPNEPQYPLHFDDEGVPLFIQERMKLIKKQPGWWLNLPRLERGITLYYMCLDIGFDNHILTKGPHYSQNAWTEKLMWAQNNLDKDVKVTITRDKGLVYGKILVDDYPPYIERWLKWRPRGIVIMPTWDYNKDFKHPNVIPFKGGSLEERNKMEDILRKVYKRNSGEAIEAIDLM